MKKKIRTYRIKCAVIQMGPNGDSQSHRSDRELEETPRRAGPKRSRIASSTARLRGHADNRWERRKRKGQARRWRGGGRRKKKRSEGGRGRKVIEVRSVD